MTEIRRRFTGAHTLQVESRPGPGEPWKPVSHLVAFGYESPYTAGWELRHAIAYGSRPGWPVLPFQPLSVRHFHASEQAGLDAAYAQVRRLIPPLTAVWEGFVGAVRDAVPALPSGREQTIQVAFHVNHPLSVVPSQSPLRVPEVARGLDFEPRLGFVISRDLADASAEEAAAAISAYVLLCEYTLNESPEHGAGATAQPTAPSSIAPLAIRARGVGDDWSSLTGRVLVNGSETATLGARTVRLALGELLAAASADSRLLAGELFSVDALAVTGELPTLRAGDHVVVDVPGLGQIEHGIV